MQNPVTLYNNLMTLVQGSDAFFFKDFNKHGRLYRIFNYRLVGWEEFKKPGATECRGTMFDVTQSESPVLVCLPMSKFFNYEEGGVDHSSKPITCIMEKRDGSLISTYQVDGELFLKSKGSLFSSQVDDATALLGTLPELKDALTLMTAEGFTVNLEYTSPTNRVVVPYQKSELKILSVRGLGSFHNYVGNELLELLEAFDLGTAEKFVVQHKETFITSHEDDFLAAARKEQQGEGYVIQIDNDYLVKVKNEKYVVLHNTKDAVYSTSKLFEAVIEEATDDLRSIFADDPFVLRMIAEMEAKVRPIYNKLAKDVVTFFEENKELPRKDYAIKAQSTLPNLMGLVMCLYTGKEIDYKAFAKKNRVEVFGVESTIVQNNQD